VACSRSKVQSKLNMNDACEMVIACDSAAPIKSGPVTHAIAINICCLGPFSRLRVERVGPLELHFWRQDRTARSGTVSCLIRIYLLVVVCHSTMDIRCSSYGWMKEILCINPASKAIYHAIALHESIKKHKICVNRGYVSSM